MATLTLRVLAGTLGTHTTKGSPLTHAEMDTNWLNLDTELHSSMADITLLQADVAQLQLTAPTTGTVAPTTFTAGSLWLDTSTDSLYCYNGSRWVNVGEDMPTAPSTNPSPGDTYFDDTANVMYVYDGAGWGPLGGGATVSPTDPGATNPGELWFDSSVGQLKVWDGATWTTTANTVSYGSVLPAVTGLEQAGDSLLITVDGTSASAVTVAYVFDGTQWKRISGGAVSYSTAAPAGAGGVGDEWYVTTDGTRTGVLLAAYVYDGVSWTQTNSTVDVAYGIAAPTIAGTESAGDVYIQTDDGTATGAVQAQYLFDGTQWSKVSNGAISYGTAVPAGTGSIGDMYLRTSDGTRTGTVVSTYIYDGTGWVQSDAGAGGNGTDGQAGPTTPTTRSDGVTALVDGDLWYDTTTNKLMVYEGGVFVAVAADAIGDLSDVNTTGAVNGNSLVFNGTNWVPGSATASSVPTGPAGGQPATPALGDVFYNTTTGELEVWDGGAWSSVNNDVISDNDDVDTTGVVNGDSLVYNGTNWVPGSATAGSVPTGPAGGQPATPTLGDVFYNTTTGELEVYNGSAWESVNVDVISDLDDVDTTGLLTGDHLVYDGVNWVAQTPSTTVSIETGPTGSEPASPAIGDMFYNTTTNEVMIYNGSAWESVNVDTLDNLDDVDTTTNAPTNGQALVWNGTTWVPGASITDAVPSGPANPALGTEAVGDVFYNTTTGELMVHNGTTWESANADVISDLDDVDTTGVVSGDHLVYNGTNWVAQTPSGNVIVPTGPTGSEPATPVEGDMYYDTTTSHLMVYSGGTWIVSTNVNNASLTLNVGVAGATGSTVTVPTGTGFSADSVVNQTYQLSVGPALTDYATKLTGAVTATGLLQKTAADTVTELADGTVGQVLSTDGAGALSWVSSNSFALGSIDLHSDVDTTATPPTNGEGLIWNGTTWVPGAVGSQSMIDAAAADPGVRNDGTALQDGDIYYNTTTNSLMVYESGAFVPVDTDVRTISAGFNTTDGVITFTNDDTPAGTYTVDLDGRYVQTVNGVAPTPATGNVAISLAAVETGDQTARAAATFGVADEGTIWVVSGDVDPTQNGLTYIWDGTQWRAVVGYEQASLDARYVIQTTSSIDLLADVDTSTAPPTGGQALVWDATGSNWVPGTLTPNDATLTLNMGVAAATGSTVTVATGTGFSADASVNTTYQLSVGPAITDYATKLSGAVTATGLLQKTAADTVAELADGTVGQVLTTDGAGTISWASTPTPIAVTYDTVAPVAAGTTVGDEVVVNSTGAAGGVFAASYVWDGGVWVNTTPASGAVAVTYGTVAPAANGVTVGDEYYKTSDGTATGVIHQRYLWDGSIWLTDLINDGSPDGGTTDDF